ncbi:MAG: endonuclease III [Spirochaetes bacterium]|nr:endonuclease III [Spirochaetota bacterium]
MITNSTLEKIMPLLLREVKKMPLPIVTEIRMNNGTPYHILISTMLSLRTKDTTTRDASIRLFARADTPDKMLTLSKAEIEKLIFPVGFYHNKAVHIIETSRIILEKFGGKVPDTIDELLTLKGVGRKTANLVVSEAYDKDGICVDTHVHRISNRLGYVKTKTPYDTEMALREKLPKKYWRSYNDTLVTYGQNLCRPVSPKCGICPVTQWCEYYKKLK